MNAIKNITAAAVTIALAISLSACGTSNEAPEPPTVTSATPTVSAEPTTPSPTTPETPVVVIPTEAGAIVTADLVDQARESGVSVYVSPTGDGSGIVVDPNSTLPESVITEVEAVGGVPTDSPAFFDQLNSLAAILAANDEAGTKVIVIFSMLEVSTTSSKVIGYTSSGSAATGKFTTSSSSKSEVLAAAQAYAAANPGTTVVDLTD